MVNRLDREYPLELSGHFMYLTVCLSKILHSAHRVQLCVAYETSGDYFFTQY